MNSSDTSSMTEGRRKFGNGSRADKSSSIGGRGDFGTGGFDGWTAARRASVPGVEEREKRADKKLLLEVNIESATRAVIKCFGKSGRERQKMAQKMLGSSEKARGG